MNIARYLRFRLKTLRGMTVVHIGAHHGQEAKRYNSMLAKKVFWVEANPETFEILQKNVEAFQSRRPSIVQRLLGIAPTEHVCINALITEEDGAEHDFFQFNNEGASDSIFHLSEDAGIETLKETGRVLRLNSNTLDTMLRNAGHDPTDVDVLVLDTQGAELLCLKGSQSALTNIRYIETEISTEPVYEGGVLYDELKLWLQEQGFSPKTRIRRSHSNVIFAANEVRRVT